MNFTAVQDFFSDATGSQYVAGLSYTARPVDPREGSAVSARRSALLELIPQWVEEGKVVLGRPAAARLSGEALTPPEPTTGME